MRNNLEGPSFANWDSSAIMNFRIAKGKGLQFRWEMFNAANHPKWRSPNPVWGSTSYTKPSPTFVSSTSTQNAMRQMQFAQKLVF